MAPAPKRIILITGCSDGGLGAALALNFHMTGQWRVLASARNMTKLKEVQAAGIETLQLDTVSDESIAEAVTRVSELTGGSLDVLLNNAGAGYLMPILDADLTQAKKTFDLNVWSLVTMSHAFLPLLLKSTHPAGPMIANHTSAASLTPGTAPWSGVYSASKAAASSITETMRLELGPFGIKVVNLVTAMVKSGFGEKLDQTPSLPADSLFNIAKEHVERLLSGSRITESDGEDRTAWAKGVVAKLSQKSPPYWVWSGQKSTVVWLATFLPVGLFDGLTKKITGLDVVEKTIKAQKKNK